jgi:hypothetical protein
MRKIYENKSGVGGTVITGSINRQNTDAFDCTTNDSSGRAYKIVLEMLNNTWTPKFNIEVTGDKTYSVSQEFSQDGNWESRGWVLSDDETHLLYTIDIPGGSNVTVSGTISNNQSDYDLRLEAVANSETITVDNTDETTLYLGEEQVGDTRTISSPNWVEYISVDDLPAGDKDRTVTYTDESGASQTYTGNVYYQYYIDEVAVDGYESSVVYTIGDTESSDGFDVTDIEEGAENTATITNKSTNEAVKLPETGGRGTFVYTVTGFAIAFISACCLYIKLKMQGGTMA